MNKLQRLGIQVVFWLVISIIIWLNQGTIPEILKENLVIFIFQIILVGSLIYYAFPKLLLKKQYVPFGIFTLAVIALSVLILSFLIPESFHEPQPLGNSDLLPLPEMRKPPHILFHILILTITYAIATTIEAFIYVKKKEEETVKSKNINLQNELKLLKSQINPHFLFNALNNIYTLAGIDSDQTQKSIIHLSDMLRYVLYECEMESVPLEKEVKYMNNYLKLFALKSSKTYPISTEFNIPDHAMSIAPMLLIPFIENALKHSNIEDINESFINIKLNADAENINFEIENSIPKTAMTKDEVGGIGLDNVKKRLAILYSEKHQLDIRKSPTHFVVKLHLKSA